MAELATHYDLDVLRRELEAKFDILLLRLTVRMGVLLAARVAAFAAIVKFEEAYEFELKNDRDRSAQFR